MSLLNMKLQGPALKVITGLYNFDINEIIKIVKAAEIGGANYVDIAANPKIVSIVKSLTDLPLCVSSIDPLELYNCILAGADIVEIGNFDYFYRYNIILSRSQILAIAKETQNLIQDVDICLTIPHYLLLKEQIRLAIDLQNIGIQIIQTEGLSTKNNNKLSNKTSGFDSILSATEISSSALSSTYALTNFVRMPIIASSGINSVSAPVAVCYGASLVGVGSSLKEYTTIYQMSKYISEIVASISYQMDFRFDNELFKIKNLDMSNILNTV
uniref:Uncharacterized protein ycf23 n=1 Tax=Schimmelmannia schousboei TaxID=173468 RepID=A0A1C9C8Q8_9FLOR|nr:hypothetical protein Schim_082 [Schimmelmannia schousboei]AOM64763.1 hypothetical protein Schim_082 [Schimmelmannia schousboei]